VVKSLAEHISGSGLAKGSNNLEAHFGTFGGLKSGELIHLGGKQFNGSAVFAGRVAHNNGVNGSRILGCCNYCGRDRNITTVFAVKCKSDSTFDGGAVGADLSVE
jgi:hypothetical protein